MNLKKYDEGKKISMWGNICMVLALIVPIVAIGSCAALGGDTSELPVEFQLELNDLKHENENLVGQLSDLSDELDEAKTSGTDTTMLETKINDLLVQIDTNKAETEQTLAAAVTEQAATATAGVGGAMTAVGGLLGLFGLGAGGVALKKVGGAVQALAAPSRSAGEVNKLQVQVSGIEQRIQGILEGVTRGIQSAHDKQEVINE